MIRPGLGGGIGAARGIGGIFAKQDRRIGRQRAEDLIRRDVMKAEVPGAPRPGPIGARGLEQVTGAGDIGVDTGGRAVNRAVHMRFGGQMHDRIGAVGDEHPVERGAVADIGLLKMIARAFGDVGDVLKTGRVGQRVEIDYVVATRHGEAHHGRADEPCPASHQNLHAAPSQSNGLCKSARRGATASFSLRTEAAGSGQSMPISGSFHKSAPSLSGA